MCCGRPFIIDEDFLFHFQLQAIRFLNRVLSVGLTDEDAFAEVIEKIFQLLGDIAIVCYPDTSLFNLGETLFLRPLCTQLGRCDMINEMLCIHSRTKTGRSVDCVRDQYHCGRIRADVASIPYHTQVDE